MGQRYDFFLVYLVHPQNINDFSSTFSLYVLYGQASELLLELEDADNGKVVADAPLIGGTLVSAVGFVASMCAIMFEEEWEGKDASLLMGEGSGVGENMVDGGPFTLVFVGTRLKFSRSVNEVVTPCKKFELWGVRFSIEITHDDEVGVLSDGSYGIRICL